MAELEHLPPTTRTLFLRATESACEVRHRGELFLWCQGALRALLPHGVVVCMVLDGHHGVRYNDCLHAVPLDEATLSPLRDPHHGVLAQVAQCCRRIGEWTVPLHAAAHPAGSEAHALSRQFETLGVGPGLLHCTGPLPDGAGLVVLLLALAKPPQPEDASLLRVLAPQLHLAILRSVEFGRQPTQKQGPQEAGLTQRQLEILHWVKLGKTNHETAVILSVSELTVKNHLQRAFRKLNVHNRAQAVARLMALDLE